jgi:hypothetical protein
MLRIARTGPPWLNAEALREARMPRGWLVLGLVVAAWVPILALVAWWLGWRG